MRGCFLIYLPDCWLEITIAWAEGISPKQKTKYRRSENKTMWEALVRNTNNRQETSKICNNFHRTVYSQVTSIRRASAGGNKWRTPPVSQRDADIGAIGRLRRLPNRSTLLSAIKSVTCDRVSDISRPASDSARRLTAAPGGVATLPPPPISVQKIAKYFVHLWFFGQNSFNIWAVSSIHSLLYLFYSSALSTAKVYQINWGFNHSSTFFIQLTSGDASRYNTTIIFEPIIKI